MFAQLEIALAIQQYYEKRNSSVIAPAIDWAYTCNYNVAFAAPAPRDWDNDFENSWRCQSISGICICNVIDSAIGTAALGTDHRDFDYMIDITIKTNMAVLDWNINIVIIIRKLAPAIRVIEISEPKSLPHNVRLDSKVRCSFFFCFF